MLAISLPDHTRTSAWIRQKSSDLQVFTKEELNTNNKYRQYLFILSITHSLYFSVRPLSLSPELWLSNMDECSDSKTSSPSTQSLLFIILTPVCQIDQLSLINIIFDYITQSNFITMIIWVSHNYTQHRICLTGLNKRLLYKAPLWQLNEYYQLGNNCGNKTKREANERICLH